MVYCSARDNESMTCVATSQKINKALASFKKGTSRDTPRKTIKLLFSNGQQQKWTGLKKKLNHGLVELLNSKPIAHKYSDFQEKHFNFLPLNTELFLKTSTDSIEVFNTISSLNLEWSNRPNSIRTKFLKLLYKDI